MTHLRGSLDILGPLGRILGPSWSILGPSWAILGPSSPNLGPSWPHLGRPGRPVTCKNISFHLVLGHFCLTGFFAMSFHLGSSWRPLGPLGGHFQLLRTRGDTLHLSALPVPMLRQVYVGPSWGLLRGPKVCVSLGRSFKNGKMTFLGRILGPSWAILGHLGPS